MKRQIQHIPFNMDTILKMHISRRSQRIDQFHRRCPIPIHGPLLIKQTPGSLALICPPKTRMQHIARITHQTGISRIHTAKRRKHFPRGRIIGTYTHRVLHRIVMRAKREIEIPLRIHRHCRARVIINPIRHKNWIAPHFRLVIVCCHIRLVNLIQPHHMRLALVRNNFITHPIRRATRRASL